MNVMDDFAELMRQLMTERGLGVRALARAVPCDHALISRLLSRHQSPSGGMARQLDEVLHAGGRLVAAANAEDWEAFSVASGVAVPGPVVMQGMSRITSADLSTGRCSGSFSLGDVSARAGAVLDGWELRARGVGAWPRVKMLTARQVGVAELDDLETMADEFRRWGHEFGGGLRRKAVVGQLNEVANVPARAASVSAAVPPVWASGKAGPCDRTYVGG